MACVAVNTRLFILLLPLEMACVAVFINIHQTEYVLVPMTSLFVYLATRLHLDMNIYPRDCMCFCSVEFSSVTFSTRLYVSIFSSFILCQVPRGYLSLFC